MDTDTPATKADILELKEDIRQLYEATEKWKIEILGSQEQWKDESLKSQERWKEEIIRHFDIAFENYRVDLLGAYGDRYESTREVQQRHGQRLNVIEAKLGLRA